MFKGESGKDEGRAMKQENVNLDVQSPVGRDASIIQAAGQARGLATRPSWKRFAIAFAVAAVSDFFAFWISFAAPAQWALDLSTAFLLFLILGRRWAILPGLIFEAIPGLAAFPAWILVVISIFVYDDIKARRS
jgi:hypothetical protein